MAIEAIVETPVFGFEQITYTHNALGHIELSTYGIGHFDLGEIGYGALASAVLLSIFKPDPTISEQVLGWGGLGALTAYFALGL